MTRFLGNWEVESDIVLPKTIPFLRYDHPFATYTVFLRNIPGTRNDLTYLSMQFIFDAPSLQEAKAAGEPLAKEFLDYICLVTHLKLRLRTLLLVYNWEPGTGMRECLMYTLPSPHDDAPYQALQQPLLDTVALLQTHPVVPKLRRAMKWFGNGVASQYPDDQFAYFWFVIEIVAQLIKEPTPVPDRCSRCRGPLFCEACGATHLHRPYAKQAIEQLFVKYGPKDELALYRRATDARNMLMHGDETKAIEEALKIEFARLVNDMGHLAWISILNQFVPVLINKRPAMLQTSQYVYLHMTGAAHMQLGFIPNFDNPDPAHFPKVHFGFSFPDEPPHPQP